jgi:hypothetical protein
MDGRGMSFRRQVFLDQARNHSAAGNVSTFLHFMYLAKNTNTPNFPSSRPVEVSQFCQARGPSDSVYTSIQSVLGVLSYILILESVSTTRIRR